MSPRRKRPTEEEPASKPSATAAFEDFGEGTAATLHGEEPIEPAATTPAGRQPDFMWSGQPVYRCRFCGDQYERVDNLPAVIEHENTQHPTNARLSNMLGPDGRPLIVVD